MRSRAALVLLVLTCALLATCGGGDEGGNIGDTCSSDSSCRSGLRCEKDYFDGQCTLDCGSTEECAEYSSHSVCLALAALCVYRCEDAADCPPYSECNPAAWCEHNP